MAGPFSSTLEATQMVMSAIRMVNMALPYANLVGADAEEFDNQFAALIAAQKGRSQAIIDREAAHEQQVKVASHVEVPEKKPEQKAADTTNTKK